MTATTIIVRGVPTPKIQPGDVVLNQGMRILIDRPAKVWHAEYDCDPSRRGYPATVMTHQRCRLAYSWLGTVTNVSEVLTAGIVLASFLRYDSFPGQYLWNVQGNELATWTVERQLQYVNCASCGDTHDKSEIC